MQVQIKLIDVADIVLRELINVRIWRKTSEHVCFVGAATDFVGCLIHSEAYLFVFMGKLAFTVGAVGVYLMHLEEARRSAM